MMQKGKQNLTVAAILPVYNDETSVEDAIRSMLAQTYQLSDFIVVDDGSTDRTAEICSKYPVKVISIPHSGRAKAIDEGIKNAKTDIIWIGEGDCTYDRRYLEESLKHFEDPSVGGVHGKRSVANAEKLIPRIHQIDMDVRIGEGYEPFACFVYRRELIEKIGGFSDEHGHTEEDSSVGFRVKALGYKLIHQPSAKWWHRERESMRELVKQQFEWGIGHFPFFLKYRRTPFALKYWSAFFCYTIIILSLGLLFYYAISILFLAAALGIYCMKYAVSARKLAKMRYAALVPLMGVFKGFIHTLGFYWGGLLTIFGKKPMDWIVEHF